jgi:hypothetical protein
MKKLKIILLSLALFAVVGGALAFKAKYQSRYCITDPNPDGSCPLECPVEVLTSTTEDANEFKCTTTWNPGCIEECFTSTKLRDDM